MIRKSKGSVRALKGTYLALVLAFLYLPILVMFGLSFNASVSRAEWTGFTLDWYLKLFHDENIINALKVTLNEKINTLNAQKEDAKVAQAELNEKKKELERNIRKG